MALASGVQDYVPGEKGPDLSACCRHDSGTGKDVNVQKKYAVSRAVETAKSLLRVLGFWATVGVVVEDLLFQGSVDLASQP